MVWRGNRLQKVFRLARTFVTDPIMVGRALPGEIRQWSQWRRRGKFAGLTANDEWDEHLHKLLGAPWPCAKDHRFDDVISDIGALLEAREWGFGRDTYGWYADADRSFCRALWCVARHTRPEVIIETGVAHGVTSRVVLEALRRNDYGHLWSVDLPFPFDHRLHGETGIIVTDALRTRWSYLEGSSRQRLPGLVTDVGHVEMFIHDSLHTAENTIFEMEQAASAMRGGSVMLIDDIDSHMGFAVFARRHPGWKSIICPSVDRNGMFGIAVKTPTPQTFPAGDSSVAQS